MQRRLVDLVVLGVLDAGVIREAVALEAERVDPDLGGEVDDGEGVEDGATCAAAERGVREEGDVQERSDRRVDGRDWDDAIQGFLLHAWDHVPWHLDSVLGF